MVQKNRLAVAQLRCDCDPGVFSFKHTGELDSLSEVIGQERAVQAIDFGLNMESPGYNIYVTGLEGTGKSTIVRDLVSKFAKDRPLPEDWCLVNNFNDEYRPQPIAVLSGKATRFSRGIQKFIADVAARLPKELESKTYTDKVKEVTESLNREKTALMNGLDDSANQKGLVITKTSSGYQPIPVSEGKPMSNEIFQALSPEKQSEIEVAMRAFKEEMDVVMADIRKIAIEEQKRIDGLMQEVTLFILTDQMEWIRNEYRDCRGVIRYLDEVKTYISEDIEQFLQMSAKVAQTAETPASSGRSFDPFKVNVLVDHRFDTGAPVIFEPNPTYANLFGSIEKKIAMGMLTTDFSMVQAGSLLRANGGYLILEIESVLQNTGVWEALKRALQNKLLYIEDMATGMGMGTASLRPEPIPLEVKVILLGSYGAFQMLQDHDTKFNKIFKVRVDFDHETDNSAETIQLYGKFVSRVCREEKLLPLTPEGVSAIVEFGQKTVSRKDKLSLRFGPIVGIIKEADYWARRQDAQLITDTHVVKAFNEFRFRYNLYEEKVQESYTDSTIMIDVAGDISGQVNALAVFQLGDISFGRPSRITAETFMGKHGIINIERESNLSGKTHDKGVLILAGYLGRIFAQKYPLCLSISVTFEQSYSGIDGDSASSTELYAILSSLSELPIHQGIAVTGSVNQKGEIQAIGGVNQKIEGFFDVCKAKGLTGSQGVMIPRSNVKNLMLKREVVGAVADGQFHVYQVGRIEEGIELLTGVEAGQPDKNGDYPENSVYGRVQQKLKNYLDQSMQYERRGGGTCEV